MSKETFPKEILIQNIKDWIQIDNELISLKKQIKLHNDNKKIITQNLVNTMKEKSIDCFEINGGTLIYKKTKTKKPITGKFLIETLKGFYKDNVELDNIVKHILDNRPESIKESIKRKII